jgi:hypothetical protein
LSDPQGGSGSAGREEGAVTASDVPSVTFSLSPRDAAAGCIVAARAEPGGGLPGGAVTSAVALAFAAAMLGYGEPLLAAVAVAVGVLIWHGLALRSSVRYQAWFQRRAWRRAGLPPTRRLTVTLTEDWIRVAGRDARAALRWRAVRQVLRGSGVIVVTQYPKAPWLVIPDAAFTTSEAGTSFFAALEQHWAATFEEAAPAEEAGAG